MLYKGIVVEVTALNMQPKIEEAKKQDITLQYKLVR